LPKKSPPSYFPSPPPKRPVYANALFNMLYALTPRELKYLIILKVIFYQ